MTTMWTCSNGPRCKFKAYSFTADNFRKGASGSRSNLFFKLCNYCRKRSPCPLIGENSLPDRDRCTSCKTVRSVQNFLDSNGTKIYLYLVLIEREKNGHLSVLSNHRYLTLPI